MHGGLGLKHLESEQGIQQVNQVLKHLCSNTTLGTLLQTTIQAYQIHAGISKLILEFTQDLPWLPNRWIMHLRKFLHSTNSSIHLTETWTIPSIRQHDHHIMDDFQSVGYSTCDLQVLNNCRLYLRITTLAEMVDHTGHYIIPTAVLTSTKLPSRSQYSTSKYTWPNQLKPGHQAWTMWTRAIQSCYTKPGLPSLLTELLGPWKSEANQTRTWHAHYNPTSQIVTVSLPVTPVHQYQLTHTTQNHSFYSLPTQQY